VEREALFVLKVLMTADPFGGVWTYAVELCATLAAHRVHICLATLGGEPSPAQQAQLAKLPHVTLHVSRYRLEWMPEPWQDLELAGQWLLSLEAAFKPDIVHLNHLVHADLPWLAPVLSVGHSCVLSWWTAVRREPAPPEWGRYQHHVGDSLRSAAVVVAPSAAMLRELERHYGPFRQTAVVYNARSHRRFARDRKERLVLSAGRLWDLAKNVTALAAVAPDVAAPIVLAGETRSPDGQSFEAPGVRLLGSLQQEELSAWYAKAAVYALPARYEPFGLTVLEAALSGCALVLGDIDSLREIWGAAARYVKPDDLDGLRETLNELLANDSLRCRMAARAAERARHLQPSRCAHEYLLLYRALLGTRPGNHSKPRTSRAHGPTPVAVNRR
jgi:glycosyltransferase involved in cell wall biosynthesis